MKESKLLCPRCHSNKTRKSGIDKNGSQRYKCNKCKKQFYAHTALHSESKSETQGYSQEEITDRFKDYCVEWGLDINKVKSYKFVNHTGQAAFNVVFHEDEVKDSKEDFYNKLKKELTQDIVPFRPHLKEVEVKRGFFIWSSDKHIGAYTPETSIYPNEYNELVFRDRLFKMLDEIQYNYKIYGRFDKVVFVDLGDPLDGYDGKTARRQHHLPQNMTNEEQFDTYVKVHKEFFDSLIEMNVCNSIQFEAVSEDNHCFSQDTEALTKNGWKLFTDLVANEDVGTYNHFTKELEYQKPVDVIFNEDVKDKLHHYKTTHTDVLVTSKHRMYHQKVKYKQDDYYEFSYSQDLNKGCSQFISSSVNNKKDYDISDDYIRLAAWIATDGSVKKCEEKTTGYNIYQRDEKVHLIEDILKRLGVNYVKVLKNQKVTEICGKKIKSQRDLYDIRLNRKICGDIIDYIIHIVPEKYNIPEWVYKLSKRQFDIYLHSFIDGDGTRKKGVTGSACIYGVKKILDQVQTLCFMNNHRSAIEEYREKTYRLNITYNKTDSSVVIHKSKNYVEYSGYTWCLTVPNSTLVVRRNGKVTVQGNSSSFGYCANRAFEIYLNAKYPFIETKITKKFVDHFQYGKHTFMYCHGKDHEDMKNGLPLTLDFRTENFINDYIDAKELKGFLHFVKGDLHQSAEQYAHKFRYKNVLSLYGASKYIMNNYGNSMAGINYEIIDKFNPKVNSMTNIF